MNNEIKKDSTNTHGGSRLNSGRKKVYKNRMDYRRLKVSFRNAELARAAVSIIEDMDETTRMRLSPFPCMLDGSSPKEKGSGLKTWKDYDAIESAFSLTIQGRKDYRLFGLAWYLSKPSGVEVQMIGENDVLLRWNDISQVVRLMGCYGFVLARAKQLVAVEKKVLEEIPCHRTDITDWIKDHTK